MTAENRNPGRPGGLRVSASGINRETPSGLVRKWQDRVDGNGGGAEATNHPSVAWARRQRDTLPGPERVRMRDSGTPAGLVRDT